MRIVGVSIRAEDVEELGQRLRERGSLETARRLLRADRRGDPEIALAAHDQHLLLTSLDNPPAGLQELRRVLLEESQWRDTNSTVLLPGGA